MRVSMSSPNLRVALDLGRMSFNPVSEEAASEAGQLMFKQAPTVRFIKCRYYGKHCIRPCDLKI